MTKSKRIINRILILAGMVLIVLSLVKLFGASRTITDYPTASKTPDRMTEQADDWSGEIAYGVTYAALTPLGGDENVTADVRFDPADDYWGLPRSDGVDLVAGYCSVCHSLAIVMQQRQDVEGWTYLLDWMEEKQGMAPLLADDRAVILAYLSREFGSH